MVIVIVQWRVVFFDFNVSIIILLQLLLWKPLHRVFTFTSSPVGCRRRQSYIISMNKIRPLALIFVRCLLIFVKLLLLPHLISGGFETFYEFRFVTKFRSRLQHGGIISAAGSARYIILVDILLGHLI